MMTDDEDWPSRLKAQARQLAALSDQCDAIRAAHQATREALDAAHRAARQALDAGDPSATGPGTPATRENT